MTKEIKVRVDEHVVKKIDELAKEKSMSRNAFLKLHLDRLALLNLNGLFSTERNYFVEAVNENTKVLDTFIQVIRNLEQRIETFEEALMVLLGEE